MLGLSLRTFAERWQLFVGSIITVCLGVALVQSSLLLLISLATYDAPAGMPELERLALEAGNEGAISVLGVTTGFSVFLTAFIVSSTFAFTVAQRRQDLALLRLVGAGTGHVRRLLLSEAVVLGAVGTALGIPFGLLVMRFQRWMLVSMELVPADFVPEFQAWILAVGVGVGIGVAVAGVFVAARRAAKVRPLAALREDGDVRTVMTPLRWILGVFFVLAGIGMSILSALLPPVGAVPVSINAALVASVGLAALSPVLVPAVSRLLGVLFRRTTTGLLAEANLRDGVRRGAATSAPLIVLVALLLAQFGSSQTVSDASAEQAARDTRGDLVVSTRGPAPDVPGVALASQEATVPVSSRYTELDDEGDPEEGEPPQYTTSTTVTEATAVDAAAYQRTHTAPVSEGSLDDLRGDTVAIGSDFDSEQSIELGSVVPVKIGDGEVRLRVVALLADTMSGGPSMLLPNDLVPQRIRAEAPTQTVLHLAAGAAPEVVMDRLHGEGVDVSTMAQWLDRMSADSDEQQQKIVAVVLGVSGLYALLGVINAVVIGAAARGREFATARVSGLSRPQVVRMALVESWGVTTIGLLLGLLASATTLLGISGAAAATTGTGGLTVPWFELGLAALGAFAVVGTTSLLTAAAATRARPVTLIGARE